LLKSLKSRVEAHNAALDHPLLNNNTTYGRRRRKDAGTPAKKKQLREAKVVLLGEPGVGKSTLVRYALIWTIHLEVSADSRRDFAEATLPERSRTIDAAARRCDPSFSTLPNLTTLPWPVHIFRARNLTLNCSQVGTKIMYNVAETNTLK